MKRLRRMRFTNDNNHDAALSLGLLFPPLSGRQRLISNRQGLETTFYWLLPPWLKAPLGISFIKAPKYRRIFFLFKQHPVFCCWTTFFYFFAFLGNALLSRNVQNPCLPSWYPPPPSASVAKFYSLSGLPHVALPSVSNCLPWQLRVSHQPSAPMACKELPDCQPIST